MFLKKVETERYILSYMTKVNIVIEITLNFSKYFVVKFVLSDIFFFFIPFGYRQLVWWVFVGILLKETWYITKLLDKSIFYMCLRTNKISRIILDIRGDTISTNL